MGGYVCYCANSHLSRGQSPVDEMSLGDGVEGKERRAVSYHCCKRGGPLLLLVLALALVLEVDEHSARWVTLLGRQVLLGQHVLQVFALPMQRAVMGPLIHWETVEEAVGEVVAVEEEVLCFGDVILRLIPLLLRQSTLNRLF